MGLSEGSEGQIRAGKDKMSLFGCCPHIWPFLSISNSQIAMTFEHMHWLMHTHTWTHARAHTHTHTHKHAHTHAHTHTHTRTHMHTHRKIVAIWLIPNENIKRWSKQNKTNTKTSERTEYEAALFLQIPQLKASQKKQMQMICKPSLVHLLLIHNKVLMLKSQTILKLLL